MTREHLTRYITTALDRLDDLPADDLSARAWLAAVMLAHLEAEFLRAVSGVEAAPSHPGEHFRHFLRLLDKAWSQPPQEN